MLHWTFIRHAVNAKRALPNRHLHNKIVTKNIYLHFLIYVNNLKDGISILLHIQMIPLKWCWIFWTDFECRTLQMLMKICFFEIFLPQIDGRHTIYHYYHIFNQLHRFKTTIIDFEKFEHFWISKARPAPSTFKQGCQSPNNPCVYGNCDTAAEFKTKTVLFFASTKQTVANKMILWINYANVS